MHNDPLFWLYADNYRTYNVDVAKKLKSINAAIFLSEIASRYRYHRDRGELLNDLKYGEGWFYLTQETVEERTYLSRKNQDTAFKILESLNLIEKKTLGLPAKRYFRLNKKEIQIYFSTLSETDKQGCLKVTNNDVHGGQTVPRDYTYKEPKEEPKEKTLSPLSHGEIDAIQTGAMECVSFSLEKIKEKDPNFRLTPSKETKWRGEFLAMHREDGRSWDEIKNLIEHSQAHEFWASRSLTPSNLRKHATTILTQKKSAPIKSNAVTEAKLHQETLDSNEQYARQMLSDLPKRHYVIQADQIVFYLTNMIIQLDDLKFKEKLKAEILKYRKPL